MEKINDFNCGEFKKTPGSVVPASAGQDRQLSRSVESEAQFQQQRRLDLQSWSWKKSIGIYFWCLFLRRTILPFYRAGDFEEKLDLVDYKLNESELQNFRRWSEMKLLSMFGSIKVRRNIDSIVTASGRKNLLMIATQSTDESVKSVATSRLYEMESLQKQIVSGRTVLPLTGKISDHGSENPAWFANGVGISLPHRIKNKVGDYW